MARYASLPPLDLFPAEVAAVGRELLDLIDRQQEINREAHELRPRPGQQDDPTAVAERADAELLTKAARKGADVTKVARPNMKALEVKRADMAKRVEAADGAVAQVSNELHAAIIQHYDEVSAEYDRRHEDATTAYRDAIATLEATRREVMLVESVGTFLDAVQSRTRVPIGYNPHHDRAFKATRLATMNAADLIAALHQDADGGPARRYTRGAGFNAA